MYGIVVPVSILTILKCGEGKIFICPCNILHFLEFSPFFKGLEERNSIPVCLVIRSSYHQCKTLDSNNSKEVVLAPQKLIRKRKFSFIVSLLLRILPPWNLLWKSVPVVKRPNFITKQATSWLLHTKKSYCFRTAALRIWVGGTDGLKTVNRQSMRLLIFYQGLYIRSKPPSRLQCRAV